MFSSSESSSAPRPRIPSIAQGLTVNIPARPKLDTVLESIKNGAEVIDMYSLLLTHEDIQRIVLAFSSVPAHSKITLKINELFTNPHSERYEDLILFWDAVKYKVQEIIWNGNRFYNKFFIYISDDIKKDSEIKVDNKFINCDRTDSTRAATPGTPKSSSQKSERTPMGSPQMEVVSPAPLHSSVAFFSPYPLAAKPNNALPSSGAKSGF